mgnify:CR=1 FL=1
MDKINNKFIEWTKENNWNVIEKEEPLLKLNNEITTRYKNIPEGYLDFLNIVKQLISPSEKTWFLCEDEYNNNSDIAFKWNEFELLSLEAAEDDEEWKEEISSWWDNIFPIVMSVDGGYSFYAINLKDGKSSIVKGYEPEFEEVEEISESFEEFIDLIINEKVKLL